MEAAEDDVEAAVFDDDDNPAAGAEGCGGADARDAAEEFMLAN